MSQNQPGSELNPGIVVPQRHPEAPAPGTAIVSHYSQCFGCGGDHETGLHMQVVAGVGLAVSGEFEVTKYHQGAPGLAHGGVLAAALDEVLGALNWMLRVPAVTGRLETNFRKPVPVGRLLHIDAAIVGVSGRKVFTEATGRLDSATGEIALTATALFVQVSMEHFHNHGRPSDVRSAAADRGTTSSASWEINP